MGGRLTDREAEPSSLGHDYDRHRLYEAAVQSPEVEVELLGRAYRSRFGTAALSLREDFCGTALLAKTWVESDDDRVAWGVDLDPEVVDYGRRHHLESLDCDEAERIEVRVGDARARSPRTFDVITAGNFSWALFDDEGLGTYLRSARDCLEDDGLLALELFGGPDLRRALVHVHPKEGFDYVWEQRAYDAETRRLDASIHFRFAEGAPLEDAFRYSFQVREWEEARALLGRAGFPRVELWVEGDGGGFTPRVEAPASPAWGGYLMAFTR